MKKHLTAEELAVYAECLQDGRPEDCPEDIRRHAESCTQCAVEAADLALIFEQIPATDKGHIINARSLKLTILITASAAVLVMLISLWFVLDQKNYNEEITIAETHIIDNQNNMPTRDSIRRSVVQAAVNRADMHEIKEPKRNMAKVKISQNPPKNLYADAFIPHNQTEQLVQNFTGNMRGNGPEVISPGSINAYIQTDIKLEWKNPDKINLYLEITDNKATAKETHETTGNSIIISSISTPGLYYWKLFNDDFDLIFCGKIIVRNP